MVFSHDRLVVYQHAIDAGPGPGTTTTTERMTTTTTTTIRDNGLRQLPQPVSTRVLAPYLNGIGVLGEDPPDVVAVIQVLAVRNRRRRLLDSAKTRYEAALDDRTR